MEYDRFQEILQEEAEKIPEKFYEGLNGGVIISEETKLSPYAQNNDLAILTMKECAVKLRVCCVMN